MHGANDYMLFLAYLEFAMAAFMLLWVFPYFLFIAPVAVVVEKLPPENPMAQQLKGIAEFVRACAYSHITMMIVSFSMGVGMVWTDLSKYAFWISLAVIGQLVVGGLVSIRNVSNFRKAVGREGALWSDLWLGVRGA